MTSTLEPRIHLAGAICAPSAPMVSPTVAPAVSPTAATGRADWQLDAACRTTDGSWFFAPERERESARIKRIAKAKTVCRPCPVQADCRAYAIAVGEPFGVWGGLSEDERPQPDDFARRVSELDDRSKIKAKRRKSAIAGVRQRAARAS